MGVKQQQKSRKKKTQGHKADWSYWGHVVTHHIFIFCIIDSLVSQSIIGHPWIFHFVTYVLYYFSDPGGTKDGLSQKWFILIGCLSICETFTQPETKDDLVCRMLVATLCHSGLWVLIIAGLSPYIFSKIKQIMSETLSFWPSFLVAFQSYM